MKTRLTALFLAIIFAASITSLAAAASIKCTVETIEEGKVLLQCGENSKKLTIGTKVKVKNIKQRKAVEGC